MKCDMCGKELQFGQNVSHSKRHTGRTWSPNVQKVKLTVNGQTRQMSLCARCLRTLHKA